MSTEDQPEPQKPAPADFMTEIQSEDGLSTSIDLSVPKHVTQHPAAPTLSGYVLTALLGEGAYGQVWRAWQIRTRKEVAVKVFLQHSELDWVFLQREVERLMRLDRHPHVVTLLDAGLDSDPPYYVLDLLEGGSLEQFVRPRTSAPPERARRWAGQICDALAYVHGKGLIHCDLKPANILLDEQDRVRVVDFGQSRVFTESAASLGTLYYMAPEQAFATELGRPAQPDVRWDVYALGATLYSVLTGQIPHASPEHDQALRQADSLDARLEEYRSLVRRRPVVRTDQRLSDSAGPELAAIVGKCLAPDADARYASVTEVSADLDALERKRPVSALAHQPAYRARKFIQRNPFGVALAVTALLLAAGGVVVRSQRIELARAAAQGIMSNFAQDSPTAIAAAISSSRTASGRIQQLLREQAARCVDSPAASERVIGARGGLWANPEAFWASIDAGPLWRHGEWLELAWSQWRDLPSLAEALRAKAASGTDRQRYVAFCLIGQLGVDDATTTALCSQAATNDPHAGVAAAATWAATRLDAEKAPEPGPAMFADSVSGLAFVQVPGCETFRRGSPPDEKDRYENEAMPEQGRPIASFHLATTEVTVAAFAPFLNDPEQATGLAAQAAGSAEQTEGLKMAAQAVQDQLDRGGMDEAVGWISLTMARQYCRWLTVQGEQATPRRLYRLPTEDEWEYACRAGNPGAFCFGDNAAYAGFVAACGGGESKTPVVAQRMPNFFGLFDMHGGLWEWCDSRFPAEFVTDPRISPEARADLYVVRGGAYYSPAVRCRSAQRNYGDPRTPGMYWGFRIVMELRGS